MFCMRTPHHLANGTNFQLVYLYRQDISKERKSNLLFTCIGVDRVGALRTGNGQCGVPLTFDPGSPGRLFRDRLVRQRSVVHLYKVSCLVGRLHRGHLA